MGFSHHQRWFVCIVNVSIKMAQGQECRIVPRVQKDIMLYQLHILIGRKPQNTASMLLLVWSKKRCFHKDLKVWYPVLYTRNLQSSQRTPWQNAGRYTTWLIGYWLPGTSVTYPKKQSIHMNCDRSFYHWVEKMAVPDQLALTYANTLFNEVISSFDCLLIIHSFSDRNFKSSTCNRLCKLLEIKRIRTSVRSFRCSGQPSRKISKKSTENDQGILKRRTGIMGFESWLPSSYLSGLSPW